MQHLVGWGRDRWPPNRLGPTDVVQGLPAADLRARLEAYPGEPLEVRADEALRLTDPALLGVLERIGRLRWERQNLPPDRVRATLRDGTVLDVPRLYWEARGDRAVRSRADGRPWTPPEHAFRFVQLTQRWPLPLLIVRTEAAGVPQHWLATDRRWRRMASIEL